MSKHKTKMTTSPLEKSDANRKAEYLKTLKNMTDMEVWQEFQRRCIPDDWDGMFSKEGEWNMERCREVMTFRLYIAFFTRG